MSKRIFVLTLILALMIPAFAATTSAQEEITLTWRTRPSNQAEIDVYQAANDQIDAAWDGVTLVYNAGGTEGEDYQTQLITELEAGTAPDVFWIPGADIATFAELGLIYNLGDIAAADAEFNPEDFYAGPMSLLSIPVEEGVTTLWGLPRDVSSFAIYYNADLFDDAGLDYPGEGDSWTWEDMLQASNDIAAVGEEVKGFGMGNWWGPFGYFFNAAGGSFFNEDFTACNAGGDPAVAALDFMKALYDSGSAIPYGENPEPPFLAGTLGMYMTGRWDTPNFAANADFNWDVAPLPAGPAGESNWLFWGAYAVNAKTAHPEEAWELVTRLTSADVQGSIAALGANIPSRQTDEAIELFLNTLPDSGVNNQAFVDGAAVGVTEAPLFSGDWPAIDQVYGTEINRVFNGEITAQEFADNICGMVAQYFDE